MSVMDLPTTQDHDVDEGLEESHVFCHCNPDVGLCGTDVSDCPVDTDGSSETTCAVCLTMLDEDCPRCGE